MEEHPNYIHNILYGLDSRTRHLHRQRNMDWYCWEANQNNMSWVIFIMICIIINQMLLIYKHHSTIIHIYWTVSNLLMRVHDMILKLRSLLQRFINTEKIIRTTLDGFCICWASNDVQIGRGQNKKCSFFH